VKSACFPADEGVEDWIEVSGEVSLAAAGGSATPIEDRNERSLSLILEVEWIRQYLHQEMLPTVQGLVGEERHKWRYTVNESDKGVEERGFVIRDNGLVHGTRAAEYIGRDILQ
jgi:hypothetical protein